MYGVGLFTVAMKTSTLSFPDSFYRNSATVKGFEGEGGDKTGSWHVNENSVPSWTTWNGKFAALIGFFHLVSS